MNLFNRKPTVQLTAADKMIIAIETERANTIARKLRDSAWSLGHDDYTSLMTLADTVGRFPSTWEATIVSAQKLGVYVSIDR
jgi:hypothetical protein